MSIYDALSPHDRERETPPPPKFADPHRTATGEPRARVALERLETLWFNTGTLCNIACANCYIESTPTNDALAYICAGEVASFLDEIERLGAGTREIGFTGGEPFMNPDIVAMMRDSLARGYDVLVLTNAMQPLQRPRIKQALGELLAEFGKQLTLRVSLDHHTKELHEAERGPGSWGVTMAGLDWLSNAGFNLAVAGRTCWNEDEQSARAGYARLFAQHGHVIDAADSAQLVLLPEMDEAADVPEITTSCWDILGVSPKDVMCASSRMVVKRKGADRPVVLPCTLLPFDEEFEMGASLAEAALADGPSFDKGAVRLNHPHCAKFCVLGGGSCSGR